jgi:hypothetical protein
VVVGVRGSLTGRDWFEDLRLYVEITMLQVFSFFVPYVHIWPISMTNYAVKFLSFVQQLAFSKPLQHTYFDPVVSYVQSLQSMPQYTNYTIVTIGHSLGGTISSVVGATTGVRSVNI